MQSLATLRGAQAAPGSHKPRDPGSIPGHATIARSSSGPGPRILTPGTAVRIRHGRPNVPGVAQQPEPRSDMPPVGGASPPPRTTVSGVAQMEEQRPYKPSVAGSRPASRTNMPRETDLRSSVRGYGLGRRQHRRFARFCVAVPGPPECPLSSEEERRASNPNAGVRFAQGAPNTSCLARRTQAVFLNRPGQVRLLGGAPRVAVVQQQGCLRAMQATGVQVPSAAPNSPQHGWMAEWLMAAVC